jgi:hypothetical protein
LVKVRGAAAVPPVSAPAMAVHDILKVFLVDESKEMVPGLVGAVPG